MFLPLSSSLNAPGLWRCKFCLAFPESQFGDLCWRSPWKGSPVTQATFQA